MCSMVHSKWQLVRYGMVKVILLLCTKNSICSVHKKKMQRTFDQMLLFLLRQTFCIVQQFQNRIGQPQNFFYFQFMLKRTFEWHNFIFFLHFNWFSPSSFLALFTILVWFFQLERNMYTWAGKKRCISFSS